MAFAILNFHGLMQNGWIAKIKYSHKIKNLQYILHVYLQCCYGLPFIKDKFKVFISLSMVLVWSKRSAGTMRQRDHRMIRECLHELFGLKMTDFENMYYYRKIMYCYSPSLCDISLSPQELSVKASCCLTSQTMGTGASRWTVM